MACGLLLTGCMTGSEPVPRIVDNLGHGSSASVVVPSKYVLPKRVQGAGSANVPRVPRDWYPPKSVEKQWEAIVIHHSATENGNMALFDQTHREENHWVGVGYDFVIGNGTDSGDGEIEVTFRWHKQMVGAHCKTPGNWANRNAVGICLVGNFDHTTPSKHQMASLARLVEFLQACYHISGARIYGHQATPGAGSTDCPGANFPMNDLHTLISIRAGN